MPKSPSRREVRQHGNVEMPLSVGHDRFRKPGTTFRDHAQAGAAWNCVCEDQASRRIGARQRFSNAKPVSNRRLKNT
jgi:hypothetical protein